MSPRLTLDVVCYRNYIPSELVAIIGKYFHEELDNKTIKIAVSMWFDNKDTRYNCLLRFGHISYWVTSEVTDMSNLFKHKTFNSDISNWDTSNVVNMQTMFLNAYNFNQPLEKWDVSQVTNMSGMFFDAHRFNQPLEKWDVSQVIDMSCMFCDAYTFNQPLDKWDVSNVRDMHYMFCLSHSFNQSLKKSNVTKATNIKTRLIDFLKSIIRY